MHMSSPLVEPYSADLAQSRFGVWSLNLEPRTLSPKAVLGLVLRAVAQGLMALASGIPPSRVSWHKASRHQGQLMPRDYG